MPVWVLLAWWYGGGYFVSWARTLQVSWVRRLVTRLTGLRQLKYEDFPGTYFDVQRVVAGTVNDALYDRAREVEAAPIIGFLRRFRDHEFIEVALRRALANVYTLGRVKTLVLLREMRRANERIAFFPRDNRDPRPWVPDSLGDAWAAAGTPRIVRLTNFVRSRLEPLAVGCYATVLVSYLVVKHGLTLAAPVPRHWKVGYDIFDEGINWERPYHEFFLYDERELSPQAVLHVVRNRLQDGRTRRYWEENGVPFVEAGRVPIPLGYLLRRVVRGFWVGTLGLVPGRILKGNSGPFLWGAMSVLLNLIRAEVLEAGYRTDIFVGRDEYSVTHILRTLLYDQRGGVTVGFTHADDTLAQVPNSYQCSHVFCFPGEFHQRLLERNTRYSRSTCLIGVGLYGLDETYRRIQYGQIPERYAELRKRYRIVGAFPSSFAQDFFITREITLQFCRTVLSILERYPDVVVVVRPKGNEFADPELRRLLTEAGPRAILEEQEWTYDLIPVLDLIICIVASSVGLEGLMAERPVIYFDETEFRQHPYEQYDPCLVARSPQELLERADQVLTGGRYVDPDTLEYIKSHHGLRFDGKVVERFREVIYNALETAGGRLESAAVMSDVTGT